MYYCYINGQNTFRVMLSNYNVMTFRKCVINYSVVCVFFWNICGCKCIHGLISASYLYLNTHYR